MKKVFLVLALVATYGISVATAGVVTNDCEKEKTAMVTKAKASPEGDKVASATKSEGCSGTKIAVTTAAKADGCAGKAKTVSAKADGCAGKAALKTASKSSGCTDKKAVAAK